MGQWIDFEDQRIGLVGVTQLPVPKGRVPASMELHGEYLCWSNPSAEAVDQTEMRLFPSARTDTEIMKRVPVHEMAPEMEVNYTGALDRFARIRTGEDVLRFARRYGVLDFCQHGLPDTHNPRFLSIPLLGLVQSPSLWKPVEVGMDSSPSFMIEERGERPWCEPIGSEAVEGWLFWSRMAASLLNVASALTRGLSTSKADWETIITEEIDERPQLIDTLLARRWAAQVYLQEAVNRWLHLANVRLSLSWPIGVEKASLELETGTFGMLGVQLLAAITGAQTLSICDGCGRPYVREGRRPQAGRVNFCADCRDKKVPEKLRQQRKRAREKQTESI